MNAPKVAVTLLTVAVVAATPAVASAAPIKAGPHSGIQGNHNEVLVTSTS